MSGVRQEQDSVEELLGEGGGKAVSQTGAAARGRAGCCQSLSDSHQVGKGMGPGKALTPSQRETVPFFARTPVMETIRSARRSPKPRGEGGGGARMNARRRMLLRGAGGWLALACLLAGTRGGRAAADEESGEWVEIVKPADRGVVRTQSVEVEVALSDAAVARGGWAELRLDGVRIAEVRGGRQVREAGPPNAKTAWEAGRYQCENSSLHPYRGTSLIRKRLPLGPYGRPIPRAL